MERINNAEWCCNEIKDLIKSYKEKYNSIRSKGEITCRAKSSITLWYISALEKILYERN